MGAETASLTSLLPRRHDEDVVPDGARLPVLPALRGLLPGGLQCGTVVAVWHWGLLWLAVAAGAPAAGALGGGGRGAPGGGWGGGRRRAGVGPPPAVSDAGGGWVCGWCRA